MRVTTIKARGHGVEAMVAYYAGLAADQASRDGACRGPVDYYLAEDEPPGPLWGEAAAALGLGAEAAPDELEALLCARHPVTDTRLGRGFGVDSARAFDACVSAPRSVSVLWALAEYPFSPGRIVDLTIDLESKPDDRRRNGPSSHAVADRRAMGRDPRRAPLGGLLQS